MRLFAKFMAVSCLLAALLLAGCQQRPSLKVPGMSSKTGWTYNSPKEGFFSAQTGYVGKCPIGMVQIPVATTVKGQNSDMLSVGENNAKKRVANAGYYMDEYEVSNLNWREYVEWLQRIYKHNPAVIVRALPDESVWRKELAYNEPYVREYYTSPAFNEYPVVGVSWIQAVEYCKWRTDRLNEFELIDAGFIPFVNLDTLNNMIQAHPDSVEKYIFTTADARHFINNVYSNPDQYPKFKAKTGHYDLNQDETIDIDEWTIALQGTLFDSECRLPTEAEWEYAAYGLQSEAGIYDNTNVYPWSGDQMRTFDNYFTGDFKANFLRGRGDPVGIQINGTLTVPVYYFAPNNYGLYNMAGNVNEWVKDVYRANAETVEDINAYRGNEFEEDSIYAENMLNKHFSNLDPAFRDSMRSVLINERGITKTGGDFRDFKDGDKISSLSDILIYNNDLQPIEKANVISNTARVYKGGGWNDRAIWLNPSQRRWLDEKHARNDIGFRCVMSIVGGNEHLREMTY